MKLNEAFEQIVVNEYQNDMLETKDKVWQHLSKDSKKSKSIWDWLPWLLLFAFGLAALFLLNKEKMEKQILQEDLHKLRLEVTEKHQAMEALKENENRQAKTPLYYRDTVYLLDTIYRNKLIVDKSKTKRINRVDTVYRTIVEEKRIEVPVIRYDTVYLERPIERLLAGSNEEYNSEEELPDEIHIVLEEDVTDDTRVKIKLSKPFK